jgi:hypothetical protein
MAQLLNSSCDLRRAHADAPVTMAPFESDARASPMTQIGVAMPRKTLNLRSISAKFALSVAPATESCRQKRVRRQILNPMATQRPR